MSIYRCAVCDEQRDADYDGCETLSTGELCCPVHVFTELDTRPAIASVFMERVMVGWFAEYKNHPDMLNWHVLVSKIRGGKAFTRDQQVGEELDFLFDLLLEHMRPDQMRGGEDE